MDDALKWIKDKAAGTINPPQVESTLRALAAAWPADQRPLAQLIKDFPLGEDSLFHLLALSTVCSARIVQRPDILLWLSEPEVSDQSRDVGQMAHDLHDNPDVVVSANNFQALRAWKNREMVRIALREVAARASLEETTGELSQVAEISIRTVYEHWNRTLREKFGSPEAGFSILALGKLGGSELNHSSDVDLIFFYREEGQLTPRLSYHEFFNRLSEKILDTFNTPHPEGPLFRVDLRLRPEGKAGPLARSLASMEYYYSGYGETWERLALIKARGIAGDRELIYDFLRQHQPFIYPRIATPDLLEQIGNIKQRIEHDVVGVENLHRDVKLGRGGIREIEFVVQTLQFIHGARHAFLQQPSTLKTLRALVELELIPSDEVVALDRAYRFLRRTEHRLQIEAEQQTHTIPSEPEHLQRIAHSLRFANAGEFTDRLEREMAQVHDVFERLVSAAPTTRMREALNIFANPAQAERALDELERGPQRAHVSARTRQLSRKLRPQLLEALREAADPDATLNQLLRFTDAYGMRSMLFELLVSNPRLLELIVKTFDASRFATDLLVRRPPLLEETTRGRDLDVAVTVAAHLKRLRRLSKNNLDQVRAYRQAELFRIVLRDVLGLADLPSLSAEHSYLAEACLIRLHELTQAGDLTIVALGKFGGRELGYGADLDIIFVGPDSVPAQTLMSVSAQASPEGTFSRIDARLRPEGEQGPLVASLEAFSRYYETRAQLWEIQALTRARPFVGPHQNEFLALAQSVWRRAGADPELVSKINDMLERIRRDRGSGSEFRDFKTGTGGVIEAEFLVQTLQMSSNTWEPNWELALTHLQDKSIVSDAEAKELRHAYGFLRKCEAILRRNENNSVSRLPDSPNDLQMLARRLELKDEAAFRQKYLEARHAVHRLFCARITREQSMTTEQFADFMQDKKRREQPREDDQG